MRSTFSNLIGKRINGILINGARDSFAFRTTEGKLLSYYTAGECCNVVYINHMSGVNAVGDGNPFDLLRGALVLEVEDKQWVDVVNTDEESYEVIEDGFFTIKTDRGYIDLEVRNEHNGYYGGHVGEIDGAVDSEDLALVTEDF